MNFLCKITALFVLFTHLAEAKVNVYAHYFGQPEFVKYQHLFLQKNMRDDYELTVFDDSSDPLISQEIQNECEKYGVAYVQIPRSEFENPRLPITSYYVGPTCPSFQCAIATQYIYDHYVIPSQDLCMILDNDIFLLSPCSIEEYLGSAAFAYREEIRGEVDYMLPNFIIFNPSRMPEKERLNFNLGFILGNVTDSGGYSYFYLQDYAPLGKKIDKFFLFNTESEQKKKFGSLCPLLFNSENWGSHYFMEPDQFLHIRMGSNWSNHPDYDHIKRDVDTLFTNLLELQKASIK